MPLSDAQNAALNRLKSFYEGDNPYNSVSNPGGFRQGGHLYNFVPALKDLASVVTGAASLVSDAVAASGASPKAVRVDSAQTFSATEKRQGKLNLGAGGQLQGATAATALTAAQMNGMFFLLNGGYAVKMPPIAGLVNGDYIQLANISTSFVTIQPADGDAPAFYRGPGSSSGTMQLGPGSSVTIGFDGTNFLCFSRSLAPERALDVDFAQTFTPAQRGTARGNLKLAGSAFVYSGSNRSLTKDDVGTVFYTDSTQTITLPLVSDCAVGDTIEFYVTAGTLTLAQPAGNAYAIGTPGPGGGQTIALTVGSYVLKRADGAWRLHAPPVVDLSPALLSDRVQNFSDAAKAQLASNLGLVMPAAFQCRLVGSSATQLALMPVLGTNIFIQGKIRQIPVSGVKLGLDGLAAGSVYYVYAYWTGSAVALLASTTAPSTDTTYGHKVASTNAAVSLVGMVQPVDLGNGPQFADGPQYRCVASYYNRVRKELGAPPTSGSTGTGNTEFGSRVYFLSWGEDATEIGIIGTANPSTYDNVFWNLDVDGGAIQYPGYGPAVANGTAMNIAEYIPATYGLGSHYFRLMARAGGSTISLSHTKVGACVS